MNKIKFVKHPAYWGYIQYLNITSLRRHYPDQVLMEAVSLKLTAFGFMPSRWV
ncbi:MAG: hypothetical protein ACYCZO_00275 [Daejeonella sp.]